MATPAKTKVMNYQEYTLYVYLSDKRKKTNILILMNMIEMTM